jgi:phytoene dehydrogenase-like protein
MTGSKKGTEMGNIWREIGALGEDVPIYYPDSFCTAEVDGVTVNLYSDVKKLREHLTSVSPEDKKEIDELCDAIELAGEAAMPMIPIEMMNIADIAKLIIKSSAGMKLMKKFGMPFSEYVERFRHPAVRAALRSVFSDRYTATVLPYTLGTICSGNGGRPKGGSRAMALRMAEKYKALGGKLFLNKEVARIDIQSDKAVGITLSDGTFVPADYVVPATDIHVTLNRFLGGKYSEPEIDRRDADPAANPAPTCVYAAFGIDADLSKYPADLVFKTEPFRFEDKDTDLINFKHYCYEPSFAPAGKSVAVVYLDANYDWWKEKNRDKEQYRAEKERLSQILISAMESRFPELKGKIVPLDMATPVTYERYCGAYRGSWMSYMMTPGSKQLMLTGRIKGLDNLFMSGQWLMSPGGLPCAILTGRWAVQRICKKEKMPWRW